MVEITFKGFAELKAAVLRNPENARTQAAIFLQRAMALHRRTINSAPWRVGQAGGGVPIAAYNGGFLRRTHRYDIGPWEGRIYPTAPYAPYVHGIEGFPRKRNYQLRPWLDYSVQTNERAINALQDDLLVSIVRGLAM